MQRQQGDRIGTRVQRVGFGAQRDLGQEPFQVGAAPAGKRGQHLARRQHVHGGPPVGGATVGEPAHRCRQPAGHRAAVPIPVGRVGQAHLAHDLRHRRPALQQVVRALLEREPGPGQCLAERAGLSVGAVEDGDVGQGEPLRGVPVGPPGVEGMERRPAKQPVDRRCDPGRLALLVTGLVNGDGG